MKIYHYLPLLLGLFISQSVISQDKKLVLCSASIFADMTDAIAGDLLDIRSIVPIGSDPHLYEPKPSDALLVTKADLIFVNGLTFEGWIGELIDNSGSEAKIDTITNGVNVIASDAYKGSADPHAWMAADNGRVYARNITNALKVLDPQNASIYQSNFERYDGELAALHAYIINKIKSIPAEKRILVTSHDAYSYFGRAYGIRLEPIVGISTEAEAQTSDIIRVSKVIRDSGVPAIFVESTINPKLLNQLAEDNGVVIGGELFGDSLDDVGKPAGTYIGMLKSNADTVVKALKQEKKIIEKQDSMLSPKMMMLFIFGFIILLTLVFWVMNKK